MASLDPAVDDFEPNQVSSSVGADDTLRFLQDHGFFYQGNAKIGELVDELYSKGRARSDDARLDYFKPTLRQDSRLSRILDYYTIDLPRFRFPWGTTPGVYYNWDSSSSPTADSGLVTYMLGSGSQWVCRDGSHNLDSDGELVLNGTFQIADNVLEKYTKRAFSMQEGGVLFVHTRLAHQAATGRSIMLGLRKWQTDGAKNRVGK